MPRVNDYVNRTPSPSQPVTASPTTTSPVTTSPTTAGTTTTGRAEDHVARDHGTTRPSLAAQPAQPRASAPYRAHIGVRAARDEKPEENDDPPSTDASLRYGNQLQQAGGTQRHELETAVQVGPGDHHLQAQATVAERVRLPGSGTQRTDLEGAVTQTVGARPIVTGATVTLHTGPTGERGTGLYVGAGRNAQVGTDVSRDRNQNPSMVQNSYTVSPTLVRSIGSGVGAGVQVTKGNFSWSTGLESQTDIAGGHPGPDGRVSTTGTATTSVGIKF